jgi:aminoglycoside phosphotransferase (APT) family kinase protein
MAPVRPSDRLDWDGIVAYLHQNLPEVGGAGFVDVKQFTNGSANLTYLLRLADRELVLRRPPFGTIPPGAHDMRREWRVLSRLWRHYDRAPRAYIFCDDHAVAGADFFVMERRPGVVLRGEIPQSMAALPEVGRRLGFAVVDAMADLHLLDPEAAEVADIGRSDGFVTRQVSGWRRRWELAAPHSADDVKAPMAEVAERLAGTQPSSQRASIVHTDLKLDNCAFDPADPDRALAVFDWDMATLGDPLIDLGTLLNYWPDPSDPTEARRGSHEGMREMGLPTRAEVIERYISRTGLDPETVAWYEAFGQWKTAVVIQQLHNRWLEGASSNPRHENVADNVAVLAATAARLLDVYSG